jgi:glycosyltransferase involved in cell wall biosynthesis
MRAVKGVDLLLEAALRLNDEPSVHWLLLGRVEDSRIERQLKHPALRDRVHALGWRQDAAQLMAAMDVFAMPSRSEGLCRAIMEAMELGLCPVATAVGGTPELIRDGIDGLLVPPNDVAALEGAIRRVVGDASLRTLLATSARERISTVFTMEHMVDETLSMYRSMVGVSSEPEVRRAAMPRVESPSGSSLFSRPAA